MTAPPPALAMAGIGKRYGRVVANRDVDLVVRAGTVHAIVGENGAGKSTLMQIAYGLARADTGRIVIAGAPVVRARHSPARAMALGLGMVHQHFTLVPTMTVAENVVLGREPRRGPWLDRAAARDAVADLAQRIGATLDPDARIEDLSVGERQRVEIVKALARGCTLLILDEPTAVLAPGEVGALLALLRSMVASGMTVVLITHKLDEVVEVADEVTVMREGAVVARLSRPLATGDIARAMLGRDVSDSAAPAAACPGDVTLAVHELCVDDARGVPVVRDVSFDVRAGEIVGLAGVVGNGQTELVEAIAGLRSIGSGGVQLGTRDVTYATVRERRARGMGHVPEDRCERGIVADMSVEDNLLMGDPRGRRWWIDREAVAARADAMIARFDVRPADRTARAGTLSGGNQQKLVVARALAQPGLVMLLCAQPTRGVDVGAARVIRAGILQARSAGVAVLLVSTDRGEVAALADRVLVMVRGRIVARLDADALARAGAAERIGAAMSGART